MIELEDLWTLDDAGLAVPTAADLYAQQKTALQDPSMFGPTFMFHPDDPIIQFMQLVTVQLASLYQLVLLVFLWQDPEQAQGAALRERGSIVGATIRSRTRSFIGGRIVGTSGTVVPAGKYLMYLANESVWQTTEDVVIEESGSVLTGVESVDFGEVLADIAGVAGWKPLDIVSGWNGFASTEELVLGADPPDNAEVRAAIATAATGGGGQATYDSDVQNVGEVDGVLYVALYVNRTGAYDALQDLPEHSAHFVLEGGRKQAILDAIGDTASTALNCEETGYVQGTTRRKNGQELKVSYSRVVNTPIQLRITITGGNVQVPLPPVAATTAIAVSAATARNEEQDVGQKFIPIQYAAAVLKSFAVNAVTDLLCEARRSSGDPWITTPISMQLAERAILRATPTAAVIVSYAEDPIELLAGSLLGITVDGGLLQNVVFPDTLTTVEDVANVINDSATGLTAGDSQGRLILRSNTIGAASSLQISALGAVLVALGLDNVLYEGTDGDITVVVIP
jgi:hypothetical protein